MLIRFRVRNYLSFRDEVEFSMIPGEAHQHPRHAIATGTAGLDVLRSAVVYGANASGKSNLIKSIHFAREYILEGVKPKERIAVKPFKLERAWNEQPSKFEFEFSINGKSYLYGFELTPTTVQAEWLYEIKKTTEKMIFERHTNQADKAEVEFGTKLRPKKAQEFLQEFSAGTRPNQLFLTKCSEDNNIDYYKDVIRWFSRLNVIFPDSKYISWPLEVLKENNTITDIVKYLTAFDTGVCGSSTQKIENEDIIPSVLIDDFKNNKKGDLVILRNNQNLIYILHKNDAGDVILEKIVFIHHIDGCESETYFDLDEESDGTMRLIDLIPILISQDEIFLVDELDRSLHPSLSYRLFELLLANQSKSQLIVTTHESHLLDLDLLRRDEIWFVEKNRSGASTLYSLEEFAPRHDKDVQKGYLQGRFGAIPVMGNIDFDTVEG